MQYVLCLSLSLLLTACVGGVISGTAQTATGRIPAELVGTWRTGRISLLNYRDRVTGSTTPANGSTFSYRFYPDGRFEFTGLLQSTMYNCTTTLFNHKTGIARVSGSELVLVPKTNNWKNTYSCTPSKNLEKPGKMDEEVQTWRIKQDENGISLCLASAGGQESCFQKQAGDDN